MIYAVDDVLFALVVLVLINELDDLEFSLVDSTCSKIGPCELIRVDASELSGIGSSESYNQNLDYSSIILKTNSK